MSSKPTSADHGAPSEDGSEPQAAGDCQSARAEEMQLVTRLLDGDEAAFAALVESYHGALVRLAQSFVADQATAEEVVQDTWIGVLKGLPRFEGRSSLKTWIFRILTNRAKTRGQRDKRMVASPMDGSDGQADPAVDPERFDGRGRWTAPPRAWLEQDPEQLVLQDETRAIIDGAIAELPHNQRAVITLRDIQGVDAEDVCNVLELSQTNQRVLLHRARSRVRRALEDHFAEE